MTNERFHRLFGGPPRDPESLLTQRDLDLAASIQEVTEEVMLKIARHVHAKTGMRNLCLAGGVALNCVGNGRILREGPFENIWIQPAAGDAGGSLGAALLRLAPVPGEQRERAARGAGFAEGLLPRPRILTRGDRVRAHQALRPLPRRWTTPN